MINRSIACVCAITAAFHADAGELIVPGPIERGVRVVAIVDSVSQEMEIISNAAGFFDERVSISDDVWHVRSSQQTSLASSGRLSGVGFGAPGTNDYYMGPSLECRAYSWVTYEFELTAPAYLELRGLLEAGFVTADIIIGDPYSEAVLTGPGGTTTLFARQNASGDYKENTHFFTSLIEPQPAGHYALSVTAFGEMTAQGDEGTYGSGDANWSVFLDAASTPNPGCPTIEPSLISATPDSMYDDGESVYPSVSADGRFVAFNSSSSGLTTDPHQPGYHVYVHDRATLATTRLARTDFLSGPSISASGRYVAFSTQDALVDNDTNQTEDIYVYDTMNGSYELVSLTNEGDLANDASYECSISGDGRLVAFTSVATNLTTLGGDGDPNVFLRDRTLNSTTLISVSISGGLPNAWADSPVISSDGRFVTFSSTSTDLVSLADGFLTADLFRRDLLSQTTSCVSVSADSTTASGASIRSSMSADGRYVAFWSSSPDLVPGDSNMQPDVFVRDMDAGVTTLITSSRDGGPANGPSSTPSISGDGNLVAFSSAATNLVAGNVGASRGVYLFDRDANRMRRIDARRDGAIVPSDPALNLALSGDGRFVVFDPDTSLDLTSDDLDDSADVYRLWIEDAFDRLPGDADYDGFVNFTDLNLVLTDYGASGPRLGTDFDQNGAVDFADLNNVLAGFGWQCH